MAFLPPSQPPMLRGRLRKFRTSLTCLGRYRDFVFELKDGWLFWSPVINGDDDDDDHGWSGWVNLSLTRCEVGPHPFKEHQIVLRPLDGHRWSEEDPHGAAGTSRKMVFDVTGSAA